MMAGDWREGDLRAQAAPLRAEVERITQVLAHLESQRVIAAGAEELFITRRDTLNLRLAELRTGPWPVRVSGGSRPAVLSGPTDEQRAEYRALDAELRQLERARESWLSAHTVRWSTGGVPRSYSLSVSGVDAQLGYARVALGVATSKLAEVERQLTPGELLETGQPAPDYVEHRARVESLRSRLA